MADRPLPPGKLPAALLRELLASGPPAPEELRLPPAVGEDACVIQVAGGALVAATDPVTLTGHGVGAHAVVINANDVAVLGGTVSALTPW
jgi:hydrogenase maturation factor